MKTVLSLDEIKKLVNVPALVQEIEAGFVMYSEGRVNVPPVGFLHFDEPSGDVHIKYGAVTGDDYYVLKMASAFYSNPDLGLPVSNGLILVLNQKNGQLERILIDECWLTDMRTAAAGAVAARHLAPKVVKSIGIVGTGVQARLQLEMLREVVDCRRCLVWGRNADKVREMISDLSQVKSIRNWGIDVTAAKDMDQLTEQCNLIVTTTPAKSPLVFAGQVKAGTHITAMGSDDHGKQELDSALLGRADLVVADSISQCVDHGECCAAVRDGAIKTDDIIELGNVIGNTATGRTSDEQITVADLTGVAVQDIQIAKMVDKAYRHANRDQS
ncbi:MAG: ornithine cyclodeaminase family protein [Woeseiaceae bacterium]|nr:ornithine cyclodeaminase family protein [Woeseiaceae bacterium]